MKLPKPFDAESLRERHKKLGPGDLEPGRLGYPYLVQYFRQRTKVHDRDIVVGIHMTYAWMPTMLRLRQSDLQAGLRAVRRLVSAEQPDESDLRDLRELVNRSVVGSSKLIHFMSPDKYPIWDRRVAAASRLGPATSIPAYIRYCELARLAVRQREFTALHACVASMLSYPSDFKLSKLRSLELILWASQ